MFKKILIANRGEIAMRIIRCCREMGIRSVLACSQEDLNAMPAQFANEIVCIGPAPAGQSYLNQNALVQAARSYGCEAIHPGYGFLSENAEFARLCEEAGVKFIGPSSRLISLMGDKQSARALMQKKGVPVVPGSDGILESAAQARKIAAWKKHMRAEWWNVQVVSYTQPDASYSLSPTNSLESEVVLRIGDLDPNEIGVEILFTTTGKDGRQHIRDVAEYEVVECNAGVARYRASILPERTGMYQVATRMYAKNPLLPHRQDFELVRWL